MSKFNYKAVENNESPQATTASLGLPCYACVVTVHRHSSCTGLLVTLLLWKFLGDFGSKKASSLGQDIQVNSNTVTYGPVSEVHDTLFSNRDLLQAKASAKAFVMFPDSFRQPLPTRQNKAFHAWSWEFC